MSESFGIIVGHGIGGQSSIVNTLIDRGIPTQKVDKIWPRDHFVLHNGRYVTSGSPGNMDGNPFGEGGHIVPGNGFLLVGDMAYFHEPLGITIDLSTPRENVYRLIKEAGEQNHPNTRIHIAPSGYFHRKKGHDHIDMITMMLPKTRILLVDTFYGKNDGSAKEYDAIAEAEDLKLVKYNGEADGVWFPLNTLVMPNGDSDLVLLDSRSVSLMRLLDELGVEYIKAEMPQKTFPSGKIRCMTNIPAIGDDPLQYLADCG